MSLSEAPCPESMADAARILLFLYIGTAATLLRKDPCMSNVVRPHRRLKQKINPNSQQYVLTVLSLASWIRMTEDWHSGPRNSIERLACVCNQGPMQIRQLGLP
eukprot:45277-Karenia_brevis.AAC.1